MNSGWLASLAPPRLIEIKASEDGSHRIELLKGLPYSENRAQREQMIAEAKAIVDTLRPRLPAP